MKIGRILEISSFITLLMVSSVCYVNTFVKTGNAADTMPAAYPLVYVYPSNITANVGDTFTVAAVVYNLTSGTVKDPDNPTLSIYLGNLYGFDIQFSWDPTVIQYINYSKPSIVLPGYTGYSHPNVTAPVESYPNPVPPSPYPGVIYGYGNPKNVTQVTNVVNETGNIPYAANTNVKAWFSVATFTPAAVFNGNGTLFVMAFKVLRKGSCTLKIEDCILADENAEYIGRSTTGSHIWLNPPRDGNFKAVGAPSADFTFTPNIAIVNKPMHFEANVLTNSSPIDKYCWNFGDGTVQNTTTPTVDHTYTTAPSNGTWSASMFVVDTDGSTSAKITKEVKIATTRDLKVTSLVAPSGAVKSNKTVSVSVSVKNQGTYATGLFSENCTATVYCNETSVDPENLASTLWHQMGSNNTSIDQGYTSVLNVNFNSSSFPYGNSSYYFFANVTGIPLGYENDTTNNEKLSTGTLLYTNLPVFKPTITTFSLGYGTRGALKTPVLKSENTSFNIVVKNAGNENDVFNLTLYANGSAVNTWQTPLLQDRQSWNTSLPIVGTTTFRYWSYPFDYGYFNITLTAISLNASSISDVKQKYLTVIKTPNLTVEYSPQSPGVGEDVVFNASASVHGDPRGNISQYAWMIYAPNASLQGSPTKSIPLGSNNTVITYNLDQAGNWTIILQVSDTFGVSYASTRPASSAYQYVLTVTVGGGGGFPIEWIIIIAVLVLVLVAVIVVLLMRRRRSAVTPPTQ